MLIDTHCHLDDEQLLDEVPDIVKNLDNDGLYAVISSSSDYQSSQKNLLLASQYERIYATVGIHPHNAKEATNIIYDEISNMSNNENVVAIGEIGLDYYYDFSPRKQQIEVCINQIELAYALKMPVVFHVRDAYEDFCKIINEHKNLLCYGAAIHCYSGSADFLKQLHSVDFYYGFDGPLTFKNARNSVEAIKVLPLDRILVETDSPYLSPHPLRGNKNYPSNVAIIAKRASEILNLKYEEFSYITTNNAKKLYQKIK